MLYTLVSYLVCDTFHICLQVTYQVFIYLQLYLEPYGRSNMGMYLLICRSEGAGLFVCLEWYLAFYRQLSVQISLPIIVLKFCRALFLGENPPPPPPSSLHSFSFFAMLPNLFVILIRDIKGINFGVYCCVTVCTCNL